MKQGILVFATVSMLISCVNDMDRSSDINTLLTSIEWTDPTSTAGPKKLKGICSFKTDGTYEENFDANENTDNVIMKGTWRWTGERELSIQYKFMSINGINYDLKTNKQDSYILRITKITKNELAIIRRHSGDAEDSGFAKPLVYKASEM